MRLNSWLTGAICLAVAVGVTGQYGKIGDRYTYHQTVLEPQLDYRRGELQNHNGDQHSGTSFARPVSYTYFSPNIHDSAESRVGLNQQQAVSVEHFPIMRPALPPADEIRGGYAHNVRRNYPGETRKNSIQAENSWEQPYSSHIQAHYEPRNYGDMAFNRRTINFPLKTVLPGNSIQFDEGNNPGIFQTVNSFTNWTPMSNHRNDHPATHEPVSNARGEIMNAYKPSRRINQDEHEELRNYPQRDLADTTQDEREDEQDQLEKTQSLRVQEADDEDPFHSMASYRSGHFKHGDGGSGGSKHESEEGKSHKEESSSWKGSKGHKGFKKGTTNRKGEKGHHDKERDSGEFKENMNKEKKFHKDEGFYGEHHNAHKGGKGKKYGEGGKHKKGHTTHGEHNVVKKDEFIKNTKFYDEDHGGGEHEEHGEFYGLHEEKKGGSKEGVETESDYHKSNAQNEGRHDKGRTDVEHQGHNSAGRNEHFFNHGENYNGKKTGQVTHSWGQSSRGKHR